MLARIKTYIQYVLPQRVLTTIFGWFAESKQSAIKNRIIRWFMKRYQVDLATAKITQWQDYPSFNAFFTRQLREDVRPIDQDPHAIISPVDGTISQIGRIAGGELLQAKQFYFTLDTLLGDAEKAKKLYAGSYATFYLAPRDYHRVHMPFDGNLTETIYIPGRLFSVNKMTSEIVPNLYSRNERLVLFFDTDLGCMAIIFVGAMIVGNIKLAWSDQTVRAHSIEKKLFSPVLSLQKGQELGLFKLGSTIITIFPENKIEWLASLTPNHALCYGQKIANVI